MTQERVSGHVMAIEDDGTMKVRVRDLGSSLDGKKLAVQDVRRGQQIKKGDEVTFLVLGAAGQERLASDVSLKDEDQAVQGLDGLVGTGDLLGIAGIKTSDGEVYYHIGQWSSRTECQQWFVEAGSDEEVIFYIRITADEASSFESYASSEEEIQAGFRALVTLLNLDPARDAFHAILMRFAQAVKTNECP